MARNSIADIAALVARKQKVGKKEAADIVTTFFRIITEGLHEDRLVKVRGLGTFKVTAVKPRESVNINTGERVVIEGHDKISFVPDTVMKDFVNKPFAQFTTVPVNEGVSFDSIDAASDAEERKLGTAGDAPSNNDDEEEEVPETEEEDASSSEEQEPSSSGEQSEEHSSYVEQSEVSSLYVDQPQESSSSDDVEDEPEDDVSDNVIKDADDVEQNHEEVVKSTVISQQSEPSSKISTMEKSSDTVLSALSVSSNVPTEDDDEKGSDDSSAKDNDNVSREYFDEQMRVCRHRCNRNLILGIVLLVVGLAVGFLVGYYAMPTINIDKPIAKTTSVKKAKPVVPAPVQQDTIKDSLPQQDTVIMATKEDEPKDEKEDKKADIDEKSSDDDMPKDMAKLNADRRLRIGAYEIVGVDRVVTLKKGQTMQSFSNKTLGKDMVVYFQVLNGVDELKPGDKMKVPKIRLKKQFRKR